MRASGEDDSVGVARLARLEQHAGGLDVSNARAQPHRVGDRRGDLYGNLTHALGGNASESVGEHAQQKVQARGVGVQGAIEEHAAEKLRKNESMVRREIPADSGATALFSTRCAWAICGSAQSGERKWDHLHRVGDG